MNQNDKLKTIQKLEQLARLMDTAWRIPLTNKRFGMDSVLGLFPVAGDAVNLGVALYSIILAHKLGVPKTLLLRMAANAGIDFGLGSIPVVGDVFDLFFKSNTRNLTLLRDFLAKQAR